MKKLNQYSNWIAAFVFFAALIAVYKIFDGISGIGRIIGIVIHAIAPFFAGFGIAYLLNLPAKKINALLQKTRISFITKRSYVLSVTIVYLVTLILIGLALWSIIPALYRNIVDLYTNIPSYVNHIVDFLDKSEFFSRSKLLDGIDITTTINKALAKININEIGKYVQGVASISSSLLNIFIALIASVYMLLDKDRILNSINNVMRKVLKKKTARNITHYCRRINKIFMSYIYSKLVCCLIMAVLCSIVLMLMKVKYALVLGIFIGIMDIIPYFGSIFSFFIAAIITLITGGFWKMLWSSVILLILQQIDGNLLAPKVLGDTLEIRPLWVVFAVSVGGTLFGFMGMLISVPVLAVLRAVFRDIVDDIEKKRLESQSDGGNYD